MSFGFRTNSVDGISPEFIDDIIDASVGVEVSKSGGNNKCKIVAHNGKKYAVLKTTNIECYRFPATMSKNKDKTPEQILQDGDLNLDEVMKIGYNLQNHHVVPILGFSWDTENISKYHSTDGESKSAYARGFIVQPIAPGKELYDGMGYVDGTKPERTKLLVDYTKEYSTIPASHFSTFAKDYIEISRHLTIDPSKRGNFFYDKEKGFHFIDLNFLAKENCSEEELVQMSTRYVALQFRPVYSGTFEKFDIEDQKTVANGTRDIFVHMVQGFAEAGIDRDTIYEAVDDMVQDSVVFQTAGIQSTTDLLTLAKTKTEDVVQ